MARRTMYEDDLIGVVVPENEVKLDIPVSFDGQEGTLDLTPATYEALRALLMDKDADGVRSVFAGDIPVRRTREELDEIRAAAREAGMDVKDTGRPSNAVLTWFETVYLPSLAKTETVHPTDDAAGTETVDGEHDTTGDDADATVPAAAPAPRKTGRRS